MTNPKTHTLLFTALGILGYYLAGLVPSLLLGMTLGISVFLVINVLPLVLLRRREGRRSFIANFNLCFVINTVTLFSVVLILSLRNVNPPPPGNLFLLIVLISIIFSAFFAFVLTDFRNPQPAREASTPVYFSPEKDVLGQDKPATEIIDGKQPLVQLGNPGASFWKIVVIVLVLIALLYSQYFVQGVEWLKGNAGW